jgi:hypothetical protein
MKGGGGKRWRKRKVNDDYSPTSLVSGFSSALADDGTSLTSTVASAFLITISGVAFLVGEGDFERGPGFISSDLSTGDI